MIILNIYLLSVAINFIVLPIYFNSKVFNESIEDFNNDDTKTIEPRFFEFATKTFAVLSFFPIFNIFYAYSYIKSIITKNKTATLKYFDVINEKLKTLN